ECPLKLDTKAMIAAVASGDFTKARQLYEKITPFPNILSAGCEAPCEGKCKLCSLGDGIAIRAVEAAAVSYGEKSKAKGFFRTKKKQKVALVGSGLFLTFLAGELSKKNYPVAVYTEAADQESFLKEAASFAGEKVLAAEEAALRGMDIRFVFHSVLDREALQSELQSFDMIAASLDVAERWYPGLEIDDALMICREHQLVTGRTEGVLGAAFGAKKAALTVDRLAQKLDPSNTRGEEGAVETKLYTSLEGIEPSRQVPVGTEGYSREDAIQEAGRCIRCHCDECIKGCAYLQYYKKFPRVLTREIYNNVSIIMGDHMMNKPINACSLCGQCAVTCPNGYDMGDICHIARQNLVSTGKMPLAPHEFALMDMGFSNEDAFLCRKQPGYEQCKYVFFPGCQATAIAPDTVKAAYLDLCERLEGGVALILGCCGAICDWAGRYEMQEKTEEFIRSQLAMLGDPIVIAGCPTCKKQLAKHEGIELLGIWDILNQIGLPEGANRWNVPAAVHDSCGARGDADTQQSIRRLAEQIGCQLVATPYEKDKSPCCGYGGLTSYANREVAKEMTQKCLERTELPYITYCMACRDRFAREGRESRHLLELVYGTHAGAPPDISQKRYNRLMLKISLLKELWREDVEMTGPDFQIVFTDGVLSQMDDRMILKTDVIRVMEQYRENQEAILDADTGLCIARARLGNVTFWVKFEEEDGGYRIHGAYSHRMGIQRRL
ncbi:MAG: 4Fe-4S dicluster domain-containing protein, partial [Lachnospiraceae bacterium]|nr:4Fe-4S dicluster domain-containing protein [Lachnospiraceae bacterium]